MYPACMQCILNDLADPTEESDLSYKELELSFSL